jgi:cation:H+ antiporter
MPRTRAVDSLYERVAGHPFGEAPWLVLGIVLALGFVLLARGAHWLVDGGARLATRMGMSRLVVGLTIVAWGTSAPEVVVSGLAAADGHVASALGNVLGSNLANIGLVLGASAVVLPRVLEGRLVRRDALWLLGSVAVLWWVCGDGRVSRLEAGGLLLAFALYTLQVWNVARETGGDGDDDFEDRHPVVQVVIGSVAIAVGAWIVLLAAQAAALRLGVDELIVGLAVLAIGTSLPELAAGLKSAMHGEADIGVGNVVGSNVFNVLAVIGIAALIHPFAPDASDPEEAAELDAAFEDALGYDLPLVTLVSVVLLLLPLAGGDRFGRAKGFFLLALYAGYWGLRSLFT